MWKPIHQPEPWLQYLNKEENIGVPLMEVRNKYMREQLLFENYISTIQQLNVLSPSSGVSGGTSPGTPSTSSPSFSPLVDVLDVKIGLSEIQQWTFTSISKKDGTDERFWGWVDPLDNTILHWVQPNDPNTDKGKWEVKFVADNPPATNYPSFELGVGDYCPSSGIPNAGWDIGPSPNLTSFKVSANSGSVSLNYSTSKVARFNLVTGDATADQLPNGQLFTIDNSNLVMCSNLPTFDNTSGGDAIPLYGTSMYRFSASGGAGTYIGLRYDPGNNWWELEYADPNVKGSVILATGGNRRGFAGKTFTSTAYAATPFTAVIDHP